MDARDIVILGVIIDVSERRSVAVNKPLKEWLDFST
jgi:hypothetical protein